MRSFRWLFSEASGVCCIGKELKHGSTVVYSCREAVPRGRKSYRWPSALIFSLTAIIAFPSLFSPHSSLCSPAFAIANPTPQIRSVGLASTSSRSPVSSSFFSIPCGSTLALVNLW